MSRKNRIAIPKVSRKESIRHPFEFARALSGSIDTKIARKVKNLASTALRNLENPRTLARVSRQIASLSIDPSCYRDAFKLSADYAAVSLLKKWELLPANIDTEAAGLKKYLEAEAQCKSFNDKVWNHGPRIEELEITLNRDNLLSKVARKISWILGDAPRIEELHCGFGPGATSVCKGLSVSQPDKFSAELQCTRKAIPLFYEYFRNTLQRRDGEIVVERKTAEIAGFFGIQHEIVGRFSLVSKPQITWLDYNSLTFVPKNAKTDRAICVEPHLNTYFQKGIGRRISESLKRVGIDISQQAEINADFARRGSIDGSYATIDLAAASDTISTSLVFSLLDQSWFDLLDSARCAFTKLPDGKVIECEKFSSMGNGFTFELETLIFNAMLLVVKDESNLDENYSVMSYGDDMIVPTELVNRTLEAIDLFGFKVNKDKSFTSGPFRESCGSDYFLGQNVRPYFIKKEIENAYDYYPIANGIRRCAGVLFNYENTDGRFHTVWRSVIAKIPRKLRYYGPRLLGDSVLNVPRRTGIVKNWLAKIEVIEVTPTKRDLFRYGGGAAYCSMLLGTSSRFALRGQTLTYHVTSAIVSDEDWRPNVGGWINSAP